MIKYSKVKKSRKTKKNISKVRTSNEDRILKSRLRMKNPTGKKLRKSVDTSSVSTGDGRGVIHAPIQLVDVRTVESKLPTKVGQRRKANPDYDSDNRRTTRLYSYTGNRDLHGEEILTRVHRGDKPTPKTNKVSKPVLVKVRKRKLDRVLSRLNPNEMALSKECVARRNERTKSREVVREEVLLQRHAKALKEKPLVKAGPTVKIDRVKTDRIERRITLKKVAKMLKENLVAARRKARKSLETTNNGG